MQTAERFRMPIVTLVDTPGAYPGLGAEERGQAEAIAVNLREMAKLGVPIITAVIGEGGSGGALAIAVSDVVILFENSIYSVISPEGCASILWRDGKKNVIAAEALKLTAADLMRLEIIDDVLPEPLGGGPSRPGGGSGHPRSGASAAPGAPLRCITRRPDRAPSPALPPHGRVPRGARLTLEKRGC
jgi:acetyl-CoA carboxylase carboxyl transferase alpha subunit